MNRMRLPERLQAIADQVPSCEAMADVGCDHGYLPIYLIQSQRVRRAIAMDVNQGPLDRAAGHIRQYGLTSHIELRLSNGLTALAPGEVQTVVMAGMGGMLIRELLEQADGEVLAALNTLVIQPQTEPEAVRHILHEKGFRIMKETMVQDRGKRYLICRAQHGAEYYDDEMEYRYGRCLYMERNPVFQQMLQERSTRMQEWILQTQSETQRDILEREHRWIQNVLENWYGS